MNSRKHLVVRLAAVSLLGLACVAHAAPPSTRPGVGEPNPPGLDNRPPQAANPIPPGLANRLPQPANPVPPGPANPPPGVDVPALELELLVGGPPPGPGPFDSDPPFEPAQALVTNSIPEPTSVALTTLGLLVVGLSRKRGRRVT